MKFGFVVGVGLGFGTWWLAYRVARPRLIAALGPAIYDAARNSETPLGRVPPELAALLAAGIQRAARETLP